MIITVILGFVCSLLGGFCLLAWYFGFDAILRIYPTTWSVPLGASICIFLGGIAVLLTQQKRISHKVVRILGFCVLLVPALRLLEFIFGYNPINLADVFVLFMPRGIETLPIALLGAVAFFSIGALLACWSAHLRNISQELLYIFVAMLVILLGAIGALSYFLPLKTSMGQFDALPIHFQSAICIILLGLGILLARLRLIGHTPIFTSRLTPFIFTSAFLLFTGLLFLSMQAEKNYTIGQFVREQTQLFGAILEEHFKDHQDDVERIVKRIASTEEYSLRGWTLDAQIYLRDNPEVKHFMLFGKDFKLLESVPPLERTHLVILEHARFQEKLHAAVLENKRQQMLLVLQDAIFLINPIRRQGELVGEFVSEVDLKTLFQKSIHLWGEDYHVALLDGQKIIAQAGEDKKAVESVYIQKTAVSLGEIQLQLHLHPSKKIRGHFLSNALLYFTFFGGFLISCLLGLLIFLWQRDLRRFKELSRLQSEFISIASHELRTPLTAIQGGVSLLDAKFRKNLPTELENILQIVGDNVHKLAKILNEMIEIEKIHLGKIEYHFEDKSVANVVKEAMQKVYLDAQAKKIRFVEQGEWSQANAKMDVARITYVVQELLSNAIKFSTENQQIFIAVETHEKNIRTSITDEGGGIQENFKERIFTLFAQAEDTLERSSGGAGLSLYLCKKIIEAHGGKIQFVNKEDSGCTFYFNLPLEQ